MPLPAPPPPPPRTPVEHALRTVLVILASLTLPSVVNQQSAPCPNAGLSWEEDMEVSRGCFRHLRTIFQELEECRAFELLKGQADRVNYLMTKQAKIVAMTCTHAALKRREFLELAFQYDNLLMEEAGQILEIETFIPMLLQRQVRPWGTRSMWGGGLGQSWSRARIR